MSWRDLEAGARDLAGAVRERLEAHGVALLGTVRADGWPRISPVEPFFLEGELVFGLMPSPKLSDLVAEPRCVLHSAVVDGTGREAEAKLTGRAVRTADPRLLSAEGTWWASRSSGEAVVFTLEVEEAIVVAWDPDFNRMRTSRWRRGGRATAGERAYP